MAKGGLRVVLHRWPDAVRRPLAGLVLVVAAAASVTGVTSAAATTDEPAALVEAREELSRLLDDADRAQEQFDALSAERDAALARLDVATTVLERAGTRLTAQQAQVGSFAAALHRYGTVDLGVLLAADDASPETLSLTSRYERIAGQQVDQLRVLASERTDVQRREAELTDEATRVDELTEQMAQALREADERLDGAAAAVVELEAEHQRERLEAQQRRLQAQKAQTGRDADRDAPAGPSESGSEPPQPSPADPTPAAGSDPAPASSEPTAPSPPRAPAPSGTGCVVPDPTSGGCITPTMSSLLTQVGATFGSNPTYCWRAGGGDHAQGRACDVMFAPGGTYPGPEATAAGWGLATWMQANAGALGIDYIIWQGQIWIASLSGRGWAPYNGYGPTAGHYDHVHVSVVR